MADQFPFHFANPRDPRIADHLGRTKDTVYSPEVLRVFWANGYGGIHVEDRLADIPKPVLATTGRHDRTCTVGAAEAIAAGSTTRSSRSSGEAVMTFVEEPGAAAPTRRSP